MFLKFCDFDLNIFGPLPVASAGSASGTHAASEHLKVAVEMLYYK